MTGPEHYREAEEAIKASTWQRQQWGEIGATPKQARDAYRAYMWEIARAQVHATLALAASQVFGWRDQK